MTLMRTIQVNPAEEPFAMLSGKKDTYATNSYSIDKPGAPRSLRLGHPIHVFSCRGAYLQGGLQR